LQGETRRENRLTGVSIFATTPKPVVITALHPLSKK
jgi:hypothetical protein